MSACDAEDKWREGDYVGALDAELDDDACGITVGHIGDHLGIADAMTEPYPTPDEVRAQLKTLTKAEQRDKLWDLLDCPW